MDQVKLTQAGRCPGCAAQYVFYCEVRNPKCNACGATLGMDDPAPAGPLEAPLNASGMGAPEHMSLTIELSGDGPSVKQSFDAPKPPVEIVPFATTKAEFTTAALKWLARDKYLPNDLLAALDLNAAYGLYLPCVTYSGNYTADWTAEIGVERAETVYVRRGAPQPHRETRIHTDWLPQSGRAHGDYNFVACASLSLPETLLAFVEELPKATTTTDTTHLAGFALERLPTVVDARRLYDERVASRVDQNVRRSVEAIVPDRSRSTRHSGLITHGAPSFVYVPVWLLTYQYRGERGHVIMDGQNPYLVSGSQPPRDLARRDAAHRPFTIALGCLVAAMFGMIAYDMYPSTWPATEGALWASLVLIIGAFVQRGRSHEINRRVLADGAKALQSGASFDAARARDGREAELTSPRTIWRRFLIAAAAIGVVTAGLRLAS